MNEKTNVQTLKGHTSVATYGMPPERETRHAEIKDCLGENKVDHKLNLWQQNYNGRTNQRPTRVSVIF